MIILSLTIVHALVVAGIFKFGIECRCREFKVGGVPRIASRAR